MEPVPATEMTTGPITSSDAVGVMSETVSAMLPRRLRPRLSCCS
jgi:hypothetical protein